MQLFFNTAAENLKPSLQLKVEKNVSSLLCLLREKPVSCMLYSKEVKFPLGIFELLLEEITFCELESNLREKQQEV